MVINSKSISVLAAIGQPDNRQMTHIAWEPCNVPRIRQILANAQIQLPICVLSHPKPNLPTIRVSLSGLIKVFLVDIADFEPMYPIDIHLQL
jgi:hypothetical protein